MTPPPKPVDVEGLRALLALATPGPWKTDAWYSEDGDWFSVGPMCVPDFDKDETDEPGDVACEQAKADAAVILAMHTHLPAILDELTRLRASAAACASTPGTECRLRAQLAEVTAERNALRVRVYSTCDARDAAEARAVALSDAAAEVLAEAETLDAEYAGFAPGSHGHLRVKRIVAIVKAALSAPGGGKP